MINVSASKISYLGQSEDFYRVIGVSQSPLKINPEVPGHVDWLHSLEQSLQNGYTQSNLFPKGDTIDLISSFMSCHIGNNSLIVEASLTEDFLHKDFSSTHSLNIYYIPIICHACVGTKRKGNKYSLVSKSAVS